MKLSREVDRFQAISDTGEIYTVIEYQIYEVFHSFGSQSNELLHQRDLVTTTGLSVNYIDDNTYMIVATGVVLKRVN